jgi:hypothetical protein
MNPMDCLIGRNEFGVYCVPRAATTGSHAGKTWISQS